MRPDVPRPLFIHFSFWYVLQTNVTTMEDANMLGYFWFFLGLFMTIAALVMLKVSTPNEH